MNGGGAFLGAIFCAICGSTYRPKKVRQYRKQIKEEANVKARIKYQQQYPIYPYGVLSLDKTQISFPLAYQKYGELLQYFKNEDVFMKTCYMLEREFLIRNKKAKNNNDDCFIEI